MLDNILETNLDKGTKDAMKNSRSTLEFWQGRNVTIQGALNLIPIVIAELLLNAGVTRDGAALMTSQLANVVDQLLKSSEENIHNPANNNTIN